MLALVIFLIILSFLILIHEFGHFIASKKAGVMVEEFGLGIPPKLFGKKIGETFYVLNLLPFGGYVKLTGEDLESPEKEKEGTEKEKASDSTANLQSVLTDPRSFLSKKPLTRALILVAGVSMNILFAFAFYYLVLAMNGYKSTTIPLYNDYDFKFGQERRINTVVIGVEDGSPAQRAGISFGDAILEVNDTPVYSVTDFRNILMEVSSSGKGSDSGVANKNVVTGNSSSPLNLQEVKVLLLNVKTTSQDTRVVKLTPKIENNRPVLGVMLGSAVNISYESKIERLFAGPMHAYNMVGYTLKIFSTLISASVAEKSISPVSSNISGPVGVFGAVAEIIKTKSKDTLLHLLDLTALLSLSLGIMNILPIPALDGGRLAFVLIEMVSGKRFHPEKEAIVHKIGMALLLALIVLVTFKDVRNLF